MNLFGFNISISRATPSAQKALALTPEEWLRGDDPGDGPVLANAYEQVVWVYRAVNVLAEQVANIPFVFSAGERGREDLITSGPLVDFYDRPHPQMNRFQYWELRVMWLLLRGECFRVPIYEDAVGARSSASAMDRKEMGTPRTASLPRLKRVLMLDPARFQHIVEDHRLIGWRYTGLGPQAPLASQVFLPESAFTATSAISHARMVRTNVSTWYLRTEGTSRKCVRTTAWAADCASLSVLSRDASP